MSTRIWIPALAVSCLATLGGCATGPSNQQIGTVGGAVVGGAAGHAISGGRTAGTIGGAAAGALIGNEIGRQSDYRRYNYYPRYNYNYYPYNGPTY